MAAQAKWHPADVEHALHKAYRLQQHAVICRESERTVLEAALLSPGVPPLLARPPVMLGVA